MQITFASYAPSTHKCFVDDMSLLCSVKINAIMMTSEYGVRPNLFYVASLLDLWVMGPQNWTN
jgi:hypothetical protein